MFQSKTRSAHITKKKTGLGQPKEKGHEWGLNENEVLGKWVMILLLWAFSQPNVVYIFLLVKIKNNKLHQININLCRCVKKHLSKICVNEVLTFIRLNMAVKTKMQTEKDL